MTADPLPAPMSLSEQAFSYWPALRNAVQPAPIPFPKGNYEHRFSVSDEWSKLAQQVERGEYRLRAPAASTAGLAGPFRGVGDCLVPLVPGGEFLWIDPTMPPADGDLVIVKWHPEKIARIIERCRDKPEWTAMYGENPGDIATKILRVSGFEWWSMCRQSMMPLGAHFYFGGADTVLGVVRYVERNGVPLYGCGPVAAHCINFNAATNVASVADAGPITLSHVSGPGFVSGMIKYIQLDIEDEDYVEVAAHFRHGISGLSPNTGWTSNVYAVAADTSNSWGSNASQPITRTDNVYTQYSVVGTFAVGVGTWRFGIGANIDRGSAGAGQIDSIFRDVELQVTRVMR